MKYRIQIQAAAAAFLFSLLPAAAIEVNQNELRSAGSADSIVFINYNGPHAVIDSLQAIKNIGTDLGTPIAGNPETLTRTGAQEKYSVIHAVDPAVSNGLDADILILGPNAGVDHVRNLRHIIAAYLTAAYGYTEQDAQTIAVFTTVYNAMYRGNLDYFTEKYKPLVSSYLQRDVVGLSTNYVDWPGKTQIIIPLSDPAAGAVGTIDTSIISDKTVIDSMRENEEDMGVEVRKDLVEIKEQEADKLEAQAEEMQQQAAETQQQADLEKDMLQQEEQQLQDTQQQAEEAQQQAEEAQRQAEEAQQQAQQNPDDQQAQQQAEEAQQQAEEAQQQAEEAQQAVTDQQEKVDQQQQIADAKQAEADQMQQEAAEAQEAADQKREEARRDRTEIAKDQQKLLAQTDSSANPNVTYGLKLVNEQEMLSAMVKVDTETGETLKISPVSVIRGRNLLPAGEVYVAVAGQNTGSGAVRLVALDKKNMEIIAESPETVAENSVLLQIDDAFYVAAQKNGWRIAKYDSAMNLLLISSIEVNPNTPISLTQAGSLCVNDSQGAVRLLKLADLTPLN